MEVAKSKTHRYEAEDEPLQRYSVRLSKIQERMAKRLGDGSLSKGLRLALEAAKNMKVSK